MRKEKSINYNTVQNIKGQ